MATYVYETIPRKEGETAQRFEVTQSMRDAPLSKHPETGQPIRRVVVGGYGIMGKVEKKSPAAPPVASCSPGCACHRGPRIPAV